jgi:pyrophosphatase PpaX
MTHFDGYLFDLDGTLINTIDLIVDCFKHILKDQPIQLPPEDVIRSNVGTPLYKQYQKYLGHLHDIDYDKIVDQHITYQMTIWKEYVHLYDGIAEMLSVLDSRGKKMAVVTSRRLDSAELYLRELGIIKYFPVIITPIATIKHKPDAEPALKAAELVGLTPEQCIMIGDSVFDIQCGTSAGMKTVFTDWGAFAGTPDEVHPTYIVKHPREITAIEE